MLRVRTINEAIRELKQSDPGTSFTAHALRLKIKQGQIPHMLIGKRYLIDMNILEDYLKGQLDTVSPPVRTGVIRPVIDRSKVL